MQTQEVTLHPGEFLDQTFTFSLSGSTTGKLIPDGTDFHGPFYYTSLATGTAHSFAVPIRGLASAVGEFSFAITVRHPTLPITLDVFQIVITVATFDIASQVLFTGNPIAVPGTGTDGGQVKLELFLQESYEPATATPMFYTAVAIAKTDDTVNFLINDELHAKLWAERADDLPDAGAAFGVNKIYTCTKTIRKYFSRLTDLATSDQVNGAPFIVLLGAQSFIQYKADNVLKRAYAGLKYLTNKPATGTYYDGLIEILPFMNYANTVRTIRITATRTNSAGQVSTTSYSAELQPWQTAFYVMQSTGYATTVIDATYTAPDSTVYTPLEQRRYVHLPQGLYPARSYVFRNKFGQLDTFITTGRRTLTPDAEVETFNRTIDNNYILASGESDSFIDVKEAFEQFSGYLTKDMLAIAREFLYSPEIWETQTINGANYLVPLVITERNYSYGHDSLQLEESAFSFKARYNFNGLL